MDAVDDARWSAELTLASIPLVQLDAGNMAIQFASGCLLEGNNRHALITAAHAVEDGRWAVQVEAVPPDKARLFVVGSAFLLTEGHLGSTIIDAVDLAIIPLTQPIEPLWQELDETDRHVIRRVPRRTLSIDQIASVDPASSYGFAGLTIHEREPHWFDGKQLTIEGSTPLVLKDLQYQETRNNDLVFTLRTGTHPGYDAVKGCSGAPIMDRKGNLVAIQSQAPPGEIIGVPLRSYATAIMVAAGMIE